MKETLLERGGEIGKPLLPVCCWQVRLLAQNSPCVFSVVWYTSLLPKSFWTFIMILGQSHAFWNTREAAVNIVAWCRRQMEAFSALLAFCAGISPVPVNSPHKGQWRGALMSALICAWLKGWVNNREAGDLRRHQDQYDVIVMEAAVNSVGKWVHESTHSYDINTNAKDYINEGISPLRWHHNERYGVSNHRRLDCLLYRLLRRRSKKTAKLRITGLCWGNPLVTGGFPSQRFGNADNVSIWWCYHIILNMLLVRFALRGSTA